MGDLIRIGTEVDGDPAYACPHMARWWPLFAKIVRLELGLEMEIIQAMGNASTSGGTHGPPGTAIDWRTWRFTLGQILAIVARARMYGAPATWYRTAAEGFAPHAHMVLDCPCVSPADYQITAVKQGYNGLGYGGRKGPDPHPTPGVWRDYAAGISLMTQRIATLEDDMPYTRDQMLEMMETAVSRQLWAPLIADRTDVGGSSVRNNLLHQSLTASTTLGVVRELAAREGVDVDEAAIASAVVAGITPQLRAAITDALKGVAGVDPRVVADAVVAKLGARLAS